MLGGKQRHYVTLQAIFHGLVHIYLQGSIPSIPMVGVFCVRCECSYAAHSPPRLQRRNDELHFEPQFLCCPGN